MIAAFLFASLLAQAQPGEAQPAVEEPQEIVVTATRRGQCRVRLADRNLSQRQLAEHARRWASEGRAVRVVRPAGASYACMARIAFRLGEQGVRLIEFVDRSAQ